MRQEENWDSVENLQPEKQIECLFLICAHIEGCLEYKHQTKDKRTIFEETDHREKTKQPSQTKAGRVSSLKEWSLELGGPLVECLPSVLVILDPIPEFTYPDAQVGASLITTAWGQWKQEAPSSSSGGVWGQPGPHDSRS